MTLLGLASLLGKNWLELTIGSSLQKKNKTFHSRLMHSLHHSLFIPHTKAFWQQWLSLPFYFFHTKILKHNISFTHISVKSGKIKVATRIESTGHALVNFYSKKQLCF